MIALILGSFILGSVIGVMGAVFRWPLWLTLLTAFIFSLVFGFAVRADVPTDALMNNALHIQTGSGFLVEGKSHRKYIVTNWHVCVGSIYRESLVGTLPDGTLFNGEVAKKHPGWDLCAARVNTDRRVLIPAPNAGWHEKVWTRGYPYGIPSNSTGELRGISEWMSQFSIEWIGECPPGFYKLYDLSHNLKGCEYKFQSRLSTLYARPGSSGSPVVNAKGEVVGVISSWDQNGDSEAGMVTFEQLKLFLESL